jgi:hypothetical protein
VELGELLLLGAEVGSGCVGGLPGEGLQPQVAYLVQRDCFLLQQSHHLLTDRQLFYSIRRTVRHALFFQHSIIWNYNPLAIIINFANIELILSFSTHPLLARPFATAFNESQVER